MRANGQVSKRSSSRVLARGQLLFSICLVLFRIFFVAGTLQISGLAHMASDAVALADGTMHEDDDDGGDCDERRCPPGCATCHHQHANVIPPVPLATNVAGVSTHEVASTPWRHIARAPSEREIAPPDRPPRSIG